MYSGLDEHFDYIVKMPFKLLSKTSYAFMIVLLICAVNFVNSVDEGEDKTVAPSEDDEWEEEEPEVPKYEVPQGMQTLTFNPANLTDEDQHSQHMPRDLVCDGCRIVAYVVSMTAGAPKPRNNQFLTRFARLCVCVRACTRTVSQSVWHICVRDQ